MHYLSNCVTESVLHIVCVYLVPLMLRPLFDLFLNDMEDQKKVIIVIVLQLPVGLWCDSLVVSMLDLGSEGPRFEPWSWVVT